MSANNQILIANKDDKWYVFDNVMAENWEEGDTITLNSKDGKEFDSQEDATDYAIELFQEDYYEYGIWYNELVKDGTKVILI